MLSRGLLLLFFAVAAYSQAAPALKGWLLGWATDPNLPLLKHGNKSYYLGVNYKANFQQALQFCDILYMKLLTIESEEENNAIKKFIVDASKGNEYWTSGTNILDNRNYVWMSTGKPIEYTKWDNPEPTFGSEKCLQLWIARNDLYWNDRDCNTRLNFICQRDNSDSNEQPSSSGVVPHQPLYSPNINLLHLNGKSYYFSRNNKAKFLEAAFYCRLLHMNLVTITSEEENAAIEKYIRETDLDSRWWTSGTRVLDNVWTWFTNGQHVEYTKWDKNKPGNDKCLSILHSKQNGLLWADVNCNDQLSYICERTEKESVQRKKREAETVEKHIVEESKVVVTHVQESKVVESHVQGNKVVENHVQEKKVDESHVQKSRGDEDHVQEKKVEENHVQENKVVERSNEESNVEENHVEEIHLEDPVREVGSDEVESEPEAVPDDLWQLIIEDTPPGFLTFTYNEGKKFHIETDLLATHKQAKVFCEYHKMQLLAIESERENEITKKVLEDVGEDGPFWIGAKKPNFNWKWITINKPISYSNLENNAQFIVENKTCLSILLTGDWRFEHCDSVRPFICEVGEPVSAEAKAIPDPDEIDVAPPANGFNPHAGDPSSSGASSHSGGSSHSGESGSKRICSVKPIINVYVNNNLVSSGVNSLPAILGEGHNSDGKYSVSINNSLKPQSNK